MVEVRLEGSDHPVDLDAFERDAQRILEAMNEGQGELSVVLCDDEFIQRLNAQFRGKPEPTDVLSFPQDLGDDAHGLLGDVVIDLQRAHLQAAEQGHPLDIEVRILLTHGVLHLLGHRHGSPEEHQRMAEEEARLLDGLGIAQRGLVARSR